MCVIIATIKIRSYGTSHKENFTDASKRMIAVNGQVGGEAKEEGWGINPVMRRHLELDIKRLFKMLQEIQTSWSGFWK
jgi:hypothetical protein